MRVGIALLALLALPFGPAVAQDAHSHGSGVLEVSVEADVIVIRLQAPAADMVGFEGAPSTAEERQKIADALAVLIDPVELFGFVEAADCSVLETAVVPWSEDEDGEHADDAADHDDNDHAVDDQDHDAVHSDVIADYRLGCRAIDRLSGLSTTYFAHFPAAIDLDATVVTVNSVQRMRLTPDQPLLALQATPT